jgi:hypothetical protein
MGDELAVAMTEGGAIYITLPGMCSALDLHVKGQMQRIKRTRALAAGLRLIPLKTTGGLQRINCLRVDRIALRLAGVQTDRLAPQFRPKIEHYQDELAPVAMQVFMRVAGVTTAQFVPSLADPQVAMLAEQIDTLAAVVTFLREHMEGLLVSSGQVALRLDQAIPLLEALAERQDAAEARIADTDAQLAQMDARTQRLSPVRTRQVQEMVDRMARDTKRPPTPLTCMTIYGRLKHRFRVGSYKEVADNRFDDLMTYLRDELSRATSGTAPEQGSLF